MFIKRYDDLERLYPFQRCVRSVVRDGIIFMLSRFINEYPSGEWIRFPYYHHVFDDEIIGFRRHLSFMKKRADFISIDDAVDIFEKKTDIGGRYFCITFDDGFKSCLTNALPVLLENRCPAVFFIPTDCIGNSDGTDVNNFFSTSKDAYPLRIEFLNWDDCKKLSAAGMTVGSHTAKHVPLSGLKDDEARSELLGSKRKIESELGCACLHFSCPWGKVGKHFGTERDLAMAKEIGYKSFFTAERGPNFNETDPFMIRRDHMLAKWSDYQLRYFFRDSNR